MIDLLQADRVAFELADHRRDARRVLAAVGADAAGVGGAVVGAGGAAGGGGCGGGGAGGASGKGTRGALSGWRGSAWPASPARTRRLFLVPQPSPPTTPPASGATAAPTSHQFTSP